MKLRSENGLLWYTDGKRKGQHLGTDEADAIASKNGMMFAERLVDKYDGKVFEVDDRNRKIVEKKDAA